MNLRFTEKEAHAAADEWGFNCGPAAVAAICGLSINELRPHLGDFEVKGHTNPTLMAEILRNVGAKVINFERLNLNADASLRKRWPRWGLARVQWEGPWTRKGVPIKARYRYTHWVGASYVNRDNVGIWDVNCLNNGTGWVGLYEWTNVLVPWLLKECYPRADGKWHLTHVVEIERPKEDEKVNDGEEKAG
jgi:hypothetical protein